MEALKRLGETCVIAGSCDSANTPVEKTPQVPPPELGTGGRTKEIFTRAREK